jgi:UDP-N-acetylglucosamine--N-acetylmuramyl-(pentapeptide) pyrophosphoryl-undecaprenol N-acetylglucosamine transferase
VVPALAVADALRDSGAEVEFIGGERAEAELVPAAGYPFHRLAVRGIDRRNPLRAMSAIGLAAAAVPRARRLLRSIGADAVMGGGGYVAGPVGLAARTLSLPLVLTEADSHLGVANRLLAGFAERVFLAFPIEGREAARYEVSGRPLPAGTGEADRGEARRRLGIGADEQCLLVFGGSLGARRINDAAIDAFGSGAPVAVLHASGRRDHPELERRLEALGSPSHYHLRPYISPFADALAASDLAVARSGGSVLEVAAAGLPSILVPYPYATADHQTLNARHMERAGAAVVVPDAELDGPRLAREVAALLGAPDRMRAMANAALEVARPDAARRVADELLELAGGGTA